jgi:cyclophilin family peptidyl-prolyl cis-trans isomerase
MKRRNRDRPPEPAQPSTGSPESLPAARRWPRRVGAASAVTILALAAWIIYAWKPEGSRPNPADAPSSVSSAPISAPHEAPRPGAADGLGGGLLEQMNNASGGEAKTSGAPQPVLTDPQLEAQYVSLAEAYRRVNQLKEEATAALQAGNKEGVLQKSNAGKQLVSALNEQLTSFEGALGSARRVRPQDPTVQWLTGELLMLVGGEPADILPYFERAVKSGLQRPQAFLGLAKTQLDANQFQAAYQAAGKALDLDEHNPEIWDTFARIALGLERFDDILRRLDRVFPQAKPAWAQAMYDAAQGMSKRWKREQQLRAADTRADNLPRVRLTIEHRAFDRAPDGTILTQPKKTGQGEVVLELFEDQAPATVANFLTLVEQGFYDGTRFHWAESAHLVVGGDPNTKNGNPDDDGLGGAGYVIPDEFQLPGARDHFRGSLSMVETSPHTASSQFFIMLVPGPEFNGHFTAFGRVIRGQEVVDQITPGRTNLKVGKFGKAIPGDLLVHAQVIRKRPHPYRVTKEKP